MADFSWLQWLGNGLFAAGGWWFGFRTALHRFELDRHRAERNAARALRADVARIDRALTPRAWNLASIVSGRTTEPPTLHRWSEPIVQQLAAADPDIVTLCMDLDRELHNLAIALQTFHQARDQREAALETAKILRAKEPPEDATAIELMRAGGDLVNAESNVERWSELMNNELKMLERHHAAARGCITILFERLDVVADAPAPSFVPVPREMHAQSWGQVENPQSLPERGIAGGILG